MTLGIICLDGLDAKLAERFDVFANAPSTTGWRELTNDLDGTNPLFTPRVWTSIMVGDDQDVVTGWLPQDDWESAIDSAGYWPLWEKVAGTRVVNMNVHTGYVHRSDQVPDGWTPTHGDPEQIRTTTVQTTKLWNRTLERESPPLQIGYWRAADALGHNQTRESYGHEEIYPFLRDRILGDELVFPDDWVIVSDHGFAIDESEIDGGAKSGAGKAAHTDRAVLASNFGLEERYSTMSEFIDGWTDDVLDLVRRRDLEALGYLDD